MKYTPTELQQEAIDNHVKVLGNHSFSLESSETGLGKTIIASFVAIAMDLPLGVICKATAREQWRDELECCGVEAVDFIESYEMLKNGKHFALSKETKERKVKGKVSKSHKFKWHASAPCILVFDEVHECSGQTSQNAGMLKAAFTHPFIKVLGLSATVANSPLKMQAVGMGLGLHNGEFFPFRNWCLRNGCKKGFFGGMTFNRKDGNRADEALKLIHKYIYPAHGYRLTRADLAARGVQMHDVSIQPIRIEVDGYYNHSLVKPILEQVDLAEAEDMRKAAEAGEAPMAIVTLTRNRMREEALMIPWLVDECLAVNEQGGMAVIFCQYSSTLKALVDALPGYLSISGDTKEDRPVIVSAIAGNRTPGVVVQIQAGSASLNLQDKIGNMPRTTFVLPTFKAETLLQALGRADRLYTKSSVIQKLVFPATALGTQIFRAVRAKLHNLELLNDGEVSGNVL